MAKKRRRRSTVAGLRWRDGVAYYEKAHGRLKAGRVFKSLGAKGDEALAGTYASALNTLCERGDWAVVDRWARGEVHITDIARAVREGEYGKLKRLTAEGTLLGMGVDAFLVRSGGTNSPKTYDTYTKALGLLLAHLGRSYPMVQLTTTEAEAWLHAPKESNAGQVWEARTQSAARTIYKALWRMVIETEAEAAENAGAFPTVVRNPWTKAKIMPGRQSHHTFLTPAEWAHLIAHPEVSGTREAAFIGCACLAGLRQQEITHLRPGVDIDLLAGEIRVADRKGSEAWKAKHEHSQRSVPIVPQLRQLLERHIELGYSGGRYFFRAYERDEPISAMAAQDWCKRAFQVAGVRYGRKGDAKTLHSLRHTFATWMAQQSVPFHVIARLMGNTAAVVMTHYAHHCPDDIEKAMRVIADSAAFSQPRAGKRPSTSTIRTSDASHNRIIPDKPKQPETHNDNTLTARNGRKPAKRGKGSVRK